MTLIKARRDGGAWRIAARLLLCPAQSKPLSQSNPGFRCCLFRWHRGQHVARARGWITKNKVIELERWG